MLIIVGSLAWWRGAEAEKYGSLLILIAYVSAEIAMALSYPSFPGLSMCAIDFALASSLLFVAFRYSSFWLGGAMLLQSIALCLQAFDFVGDGPSTRLHYMINNILSYAMLLCLVAGLIGSWRMRGRRAPVIKPAPLPVGPATS